MMHNGSGPMSRPDSLLIPSSTQHQQQQHQQFYAPHPPSTGTSSMVTSTASLLNTPTAGTPLLLTPNTLKSIEHSILQTLGEDTEEGGFLMESQQYSGNFVPPLPSSTSTITLINTWQGGQVSSDCLQQKDDGGAGEQNVCPAKSDHNMNNDDDDDDEDDNDQEMRVENKVAEKKKPVRKSAPRRAPPVRKGSGEQRSKSGPRRQASDKPPKTREEDERRMIRRERNKLAAARCRKRRVDHTRKLEDETDGLEAKKRALQNQITELHSQKEELEFLLEAHNCVKKVIKNEVLADLQNLPNNKDSAIKLKRPSSLSVIPVSISGGGGAPPIPISTPSNGIAGLGFEPLEWAVNTPGADDESGRAIHHGIPSSDILTKVHSPLVTPVLPFKRLQDL